MPKLLPPTVDLHRSFVAAIREYQAPDAAAPSYVADLDPDRLTRARDFADYVDRLLARRYEDTPRPPGWVPDTTLWWAEAEEFLGELQIRHRLTPQLEQVGGHIGYDVRPSARRRGHATAMLRAGLPVARQLGIERALLTCDHDNVGSRKVIEAKRRRVHRPSRQQAALLGPDRPALSEPSWRSRCPGADAGPS